MSKPITALRPVAELPPRSTAGRPEALRGLVRCDRHVLRGSVRRRCPLPAIPSRLVPPADPARPATQLPAGRRPGPSSDRHRRHGALRRPPFFEAARLRRRRRDLDRVDLRRGALRCCPALQGHQRQQLAIPWRHGRDRTWATSRSVRCPTPHPGSTGTWTAFRIPTRSPNDDRHHVLAWAEEVARHARGLLPRLEQARLPRRHACATPPATGTPTCGSHASPTRRSLFNIAWTFPLHAEWPMILTEGDVMPHPALDRAWSDQGRRQELRAPQPLPRPPRAGDRRGRRRRGGQLGLRLEPPPRHGGRRRGVLRLGVKPPPHRPGPDALRGHSGARPKVTSAGLCLGAWKCDSAGRSSCRCSRSCV
jgi:hypothetical protein